jgi:hypothetical protein
LAAFDPYACPFFFAVVSGSPQTDLGTSGLKPSFILLLIAALKHSATLTLYAALKRRSSTVVLAAVEVFSVQGQGQDQHQNQRTGVSVLHEPVVEMPCQADSGVRG